MPFKNIKELENRVKSVKTLPMKAKKIWLSAFNKAINKYSEESSIKIAWTAVKQSYKKLDNKWVIRKSVKLNSVIQKSGFFNPSYMFDVSLTDCWDDLDNDNVSIDLLKKIASNKDMIDYDGDFQHLKLDGDSSYKGIAKLVDIMYDSGKLVGKFMFNKNHNKYNDILKQLKNKPKIGVSAEFYNYKKDGNTIVDCDRLGWTIDLADRLRNPRSIAIQ